MRASRSRPFLVALVSFLCLVLAACAAPADQGGADGDDDGGAGASPAPTDNGEATDGGGGQTSGEPIVIGANIELSGGASVQGQAYADALNLLSQQMNDNGGIMGRPVEVEIVDNSTDQTEAVTVTRRLVEQGAVAMIGPGTSPTTLAAMDAIIETGIPTISMGSANPIVEPVEERPNVFKTAQNGSLMAEVIVAHAKKNGLTQLGLIAVNNPYGDSGITAMQQATEDAGLQLVGTEKFEGDDPDVTPQLNNLINAGAEAIVTWAIPPGAPTVRRNAVENLGIEMPMYFDAGAGAELFVDLAGDAANGALIAHPKTMVWDEVPSDDPQSEVLQSFGQAYTDEHGEMSGFAGYAWDALGLLKAAIEDAGSTEPEAITSALEGLGEYTGVTGTFEISAQNHQGLGDGDLVMLTIEDGEWTYAE